MFIISTWGYNVITVEFVENSSFYIKYQCFLTSLPVLLSIIMEFIEIFLAILSVMVIVTMVMKERDND